MRWFLLLALLGALLPGCATPPRRAEPVAPDWTIAPSLLPAVQLSQQLHLERGGEQRRFEALLEIDADALRLVAFAAQQPAFRLHWDGETLRSEQAEWLPAAFRPQWVLNDLLLLLAPGDALRAQMPAGYTLDEAAGRRELRWQGQAIMIAERKEALWAVENLPHGYRLRIANVEAGTPP